MWLSEENPRVDLLARMTEGSLRHVEIESRLPPDMARREAEYYLGLYRLFGEHVDQVVLHVGNEPLRRAVTRFRSPVMDFKFRLLDIREFDGEPLIKSADLKDNLLALLTRADQERVMRSVEERLAKLQGREQETAARLYVLISGLRGLEETVAGRLSMIDVMENKVFSGIIRKSRREGLVEGQAEFLTKMLEAKFGKPLPRAMARRIEDVF